MVVVNFEDRERLFQIKLHIEAQGRVMKALDFRAKVKEQRSCILTVSVVVTQIVGTTAHRPT